jgi:hypothetical protein
MKKYSPTSFAVFDCRLTVKMLRASGGILLLIALFFLFSKASYAQSGGIITAINISARAAVGGGKNDVLDGGFIVVRAPKSVLIRALGPSLAAAGITGALQDPTLELHDSSGSIIASNDNWRDSQETAQIVATGIPPNDDRESALLLTLQPGSYTAVAQGKADTTSVAVVELYDLEAAEGGQVTNSSARGNASEVESTIINGFVIPQDTLPRVLVRAIGPELAAAGLTEVLQNPTLELRDGNGNLLAFNDDWETDQEAEILFSGQAPTDPRESAIVRRLNPGFYTAIMRGKNATLGFGLVEVYLLP